MKKLMVALLAASCVGCAWTEQVARNYTNSAAEEVNKAAFDGKIQCTVRFCDRNKNPECAKHHTAYDPIRKEIHISPEWYWEPRWYFQGAIAHEMIHIYLEQTHQEARMKELPHSWQFQQERERVAKALDVPEWTIPDGKKSGDKLDATRLIAWLGKHLQQMVDEVHGLKGHVDYSTAGWPTEIYDDEDFRAMPPQPPIK